ncbi:MAG: hypothetical protein M3032_05465, partial [Verrucomicrobiota bacterium]|nr:hypothetical protein [Verrucomicrobiota bacterium]
LAPATDRDLETIVARCLDRDPKARYRSAGQLAEDLERWLDGRPIIARPVLPTAQLWRWSRRNPMLAAVVAACLILAIAVVWLLQTQPSAAPIGRADKSITVLPFANLNGDKDSEFFAAGIQEDILTNLTKVADLKVISQSSVRGFQPGKPRNLQEIGSALGVGHVLEGSVRRSENRVRISAHLRDTATGAELWAEQYDRDLRDVFAIQSEIAQKIADQLRVQLSPTEQAVIRAKPTDDIVAYDLYLRAKEIGQRAGLSTTERTSKQVELLEEAVTRDPSFLSALCLLGRVHVFSYWTNHDHTAARLQAAHDALERAAQLKADAGEVHLTRGIIQYWGHREYQTALAELMTARQALPNDAEVPYFVALVQRRQGKWDLSTRHFEEARKKDPRNEVILFDLARTNYFALKRYREAAETCDDVLKWKPDSFDFQLARAKVDVSRQADLRRWESVVWGPSAKDAEPDLLAFERLELALAKRDYRAAESALATQNLPQFNWAGYVTPRGYYAGLIARGLGDEAKARLEFTGARECLAEIVQSRPDDAKAHIVLAQVLARLGERDAAIAEGETATQLRPVTRDAVDGPSLLGMLAGVCAEVGATDRALDLLELAAPMPNVTNYGALQTEDVWDSLRTNARFKRIVSSLAPGAGDK